MTHSGNTTDRQGPKSAPTSIQGFGVLVCLDPDFRHVRQVSANVEDLLGLSVEECLGASASRVLGKSLTRRLRVGLQARQRIPGALLTNRSAASKGRAQRLRVLAYRSNAGVVVELEAISSTSKQQQWLSVVNDRLGVIVSTADAALLLDTLARTLRVLTAYDRVLVHSFDANGNSQVLAEDCAEDLPSLLGYRFPASYVAPATREAYRQNLVRMVADTGAAPVPLVAEEGTEPCALDLTPGILRTSSEMKLENLSDANIGASLAIAIFSEQRLWGRVLCHSRHPRRLLPAAREAAANLTQVAAQRLFLLEAQAEARYREEVQNNRVLLDRSIRRRAAPRGLLRQHGAQWLRLFNACGLSLIYRNAVYCEGSTPEADAIRALAVWLEGRLTENEVWSTTALAEEGFTDADGYCGLLAVPLAIDMSARGWLLIFRREAPQTIDWAGLPGDVPAGVGNATQLQNGLTTWREACRGHSLRWRLAERLAVRDLGEDLAVVAAAHEIVRLNKNLRKEQQALAETNEQLRHLAQTDSLTGTWNRCKIEELMDQALATAKRYQEPFALLLFDVDHFKQVNDSYGHNEGDRVLKMLVERAGNCLRGSDQMGRWGGEEFVILAANTQAEEAAALAERLLQDVRGTDFGLERQVTISIGISQWREGDDRKRLVARADDAMYRAKESGRDQVCWSD